MIAVLKDAAGKIKETRERWRNEDPRAGPNTGVNEEAIARQRPNDNLQDPNDAPHRRDGTRRPHPGAPDTAPGGGTPG